MIKLLIVDDSALMRRLLGEIFSPQEGFEVASARDGAEALQALHAFQPDVVTLDVNMPGLDGLDCLDRIMVERPCPVVMVSTLTESGAETTLRALELGAVDFASKPEGAISLKMDELTQLLLEKVRSASRARVSKAHRLGERIRMKAPAAPNAARPVPTRRLRAEGLRPEPASGPAGTGAATEGLVLVGCSTGGPPALDALLEPLPGDFPWPVIVAQHMPATFTGPLARRLDGLCALDVVEVTVPTAIEPGRVYVAKGDADVIVAMRPAGLTVLPAPSMADFRWHPSVDRLVDSALACVAVESLVGVLMTGMGNDGAAAMSRLRAGGGRTIAESEETAVVWGMPGELVKAGGAEFVRPLDRIAAQLLSLAFRP